ncbi:MAG: chlorophyll synthesis pathway protein BchC [Chlorobiales bacterium]|nr:chlorophyll synthesis pathway protein BchC [Chlorobiales bacterium]
MKSKAVVFSGPGKIELREVSLRPMNPDDVILETYWSSISAGTEKMLLDGRLPSMQMTRYPVIPGYETVGKIIKRGANVPEDLEGKFVYVSGSLGYTDVNAAFGGASRYIVSPSHKITVLESISDPSVGIALPLGATALHAVDLANVRGKKVLSVGQGAVGLLVSEFARVFGAEQIVATDLHSSRLAKSCADIKINISETPAEEVLGNMEFDVLIDSSGSMKAVEENLRYLKMHGSVVFAGFYERIDLAYEQIFMKELSLICAKQWALGDLDRVRDMMQDSLIDFKKIFTHFDSAFGNIAEAYHTAFTNPDCLKMILSWQED